MAAAAPAFAMLSLAGTGLSAYGQIQAGNVQKQIGEQNAQIAEANARQAELATADQLSQLARRRDITIGKQKAAFAAAGVKRTGTALDMLTDTAIVAERDANRIAQAGTFARQGYLMQAAQSRYYGKQAQFSSRIGAGTTLLTGFGQTGLAYGIGKNVGLSSFRN